MEETIKKIKALFKELEQRLSDPKILQDMHLLTRYSSEHAQLKEKIELINRIDEIERAQIEAKNNLHDPEIGRLAESELIILEEKLRILMLEFEGLLVPQDPRNKKNVIIEIRAGAGGDEASLFAGELFRMYSRFAERKSWTVEIIDMNKIELGGYKEIIFEIKGKNVFGALKFESGVHRVQRVPATEKSGRVHTSTITVAVLSEAEDVDVHIESKDLRVDTYRSSGAGGQHVNKTESAIRITHIPTNTVVSCQSERSQLQNREKALMLLRSRLLAVEEERRVKKRVDQRRSQIGNGDRSEKIRTYNFPQDRITDHRININWKNIPVIMDGEIDEIIKNLQQAEREELLENARS